MSAILAWARQVVLPAAAVLVAAMLVLTGCGSGTAIPGAPTATLPAGDAASHLAAAQSALAGGNLTLAEQEFKNVLALDPGSARAHLGLGNVYFSLDRLQDAETAYQAALKADPGLSAAIMNLGVVYYRLEKFSLAAEQFNKAISLDPNDAQALYMLAAVRLQEKNLPEAETLLLRARDVQPDLPEVYYGLGVLYRLKGQKADAIAAFERFLTVGPAQDPAARDEALKELDALRRP